MNNYFKIFLTVVLVSAVGFLMSLGYNFLRMTDTAFNIGGVLLITATILGAYWCLHQMWIKPIPKDAKIEFGNKRADGDKPESATNKKEETKQ